MASNTADFDTQISSASSSFNTTFQDGQSFSTTLNTNTTEINTELDTQKVSFTTSFSDEQTFDTGLSQFYYTVTSDYEKLKNLPQINSVTLIGNKTSDDLGIVTLVQKNTHFEFPNIGKTNTVYVASEEGNTYICLCKEYCRF